jgi:hypothetical protein
MSENFVYGVLTPARAAAPHVAGVLALVRQRANQLGPIFDQALPFEVVSTLPAAGAPIEAGQYIVLGVRAPDSPSGAP